MRNFIPDQTTHTTRLRTIQGLPTPTTKSERHHRPPEALGEFLQASGAFTKTGEKRAGRRTARWEDEPEPEPEGEETDDETSNGDDADDNEEEEEDTNNKLPRGGAEDHSDTWY
ncbi:hypothetical protein SCP_0411920 [Sparassis crispa]|uniref:Uncharacterized protein n=1 Tax=Sparassis crispa TaxID=139825 RepID=A0A401GKX3_9APHY|nr:hypothetical protein SCP_0411920 [Sparassis crispa]GBE82806.1 hypothetical protein SCP_0411920 [Sparassis crispa]